MVSYGLSVYLESISFDTTSFEVVVVGIKVGKFGWKHGKFDQMVLGEIQVLQKGKLREGPILNLRNLVPCQVNPLQSHCG